MAIKSGNQFITDVHKLAGLYIDHKILRELFIPLLRIDDVSRIIEEYIGNNIFLETLISTVNSIKTRRFWHAWKFARVLHAAYMFPKKFKNTNSLFGSPFILKEWLRSDANVHFIESYREFGRPFVYQVNDFIYCEFIDHNFEPTTIDFAVIVLITPGNSVSVRFSHNFANINDKFNLIGKVIHKEDFIGIQEAYDKNAPFNFCGHELEIVGLSGGIKDFLNNLRNGKKHEASTFGLHGCGVFRIGFNIKEYSAKKLI